MENRRDFIKKAALFGGVIGTGAMNSEVFSKLEISSGNPGSSNYIKFTGKSVTTYKPLETVALAGLPQSTIYIIDGNGSIYIKKEVKDTFNFRAGGALGNQMIILMDKKGKFVDSASFNLNAKTEINDKGGVYKNLLNDLYFSMLNEFGQVGIVRIEGKYYQFFVRWLRDHVHTMKGMKYFYPELKTGIELYSDFQREDGMIWDNIYDRTTEPSHWEDRFSYGNFYKAIENLKYELKRIPVENDVEFLFLEGLYYTWKATGDDEWMKSILDKAIKAVNYSYSDPYRWSEKYQLLKRGYTIDTWDFQSTFDVELTGDPMVVKLDKSHFGVMYGDNTGMAAGLKYLSEMLDYADRPEEAKKYKLLSSELMERLNKLSWNGEFFTHHVPEEKTSHRDFGIDTDKQVSLSNAYSINRTLSHEQAVAIIKTYQRIKKEMPSSSPGEWYTIYPPFENGFGDHNSKWEYMNGGVISIVAGELAHGAFEHGYEKYGADILNRIAKLAASTGNYLYCTYKGSMPEYPVRSFETLNLRSIANTDTSGQGADNVPGWTMEGENDLHEFPVGRQLFHDIPFDLLDPAKNGRKACLGISSAEGYATNAILPVNRKATSVYFLQTRGGKGGDPAGKYVFRYSDDTSHTEFMAAPRIGNWWFPSAPASTRGEISTVIGWRGRNIFSGSVGVYLTGVNNPFPDKTIKEIYFESLENDSKWMVMGVSLSDAKVFFQPPVMSYGIPDNWGAAANVYALVEGLAGVKDLGVAFDHNLIAPRWSSCNVEESDVCIKYEASGGYVGYKYSLNGNDLKLHYTSSGQKTTVKILLQENKKVTSMKINGVSFVAVTEKIEKSEYLVFETEGKDVKEVEIQLS